MPNDNIVTEEQVITNPQFIDTDTFNFLDLEDVVQEDANELGYSTKQTGKDLMSAEDISDLGVSDEETEEEDEDEGDVDDDSDDDDSEEESEGSDEVSEETPDEEEVDFETYEVTLPNGEVVVLSDAIAGYRNAETLRKEREDFESTREAFVKKSETVTRQLELARLEADRVIEDYEDFDWATYKKDDPVGYVENREFLDRYKSRRDEIINAMEEIDAKKKADESENFKEKAREAGVILARDIPGWSNDLYQQLMVYAVENGANSEDIANSVDPTIFKVLYKAMQYEKGKQVVKAKVKKIGGSPQKVVKATSKPAQVTNKEGANRKAIIRKMENGGLTERELSSSFSLLED